MVLSDDRHDQSIRIPVWFLVDVAPKIREIEELQVMLATFRLAGDPDFTRPVHLEDLLLDEPLNTALKLEGAARPPIDRIRRGCELAVARDVLLRFEVTNEARPNDAWILIATTDNRRRLHRYRTGKLDPPVRTDSDSQPGSVQPSRPAIFTRYEQNIGLVTPIIADRLTEALELYPERWIEDAIEAAVSYNRRNWRYIQRILETWATEGRSDETDRRHQPTSPGFDPERHLRGEFASVFRRRKRT
jgi:DNA replication protein